jgi:hypothetical protein
MNRKTFLAKSISAATAAGVGIAVGSNLPGAPSPQNEKPNEEDSKVKFFHGWVEALMQNLDSQLDEKSRIALMEACGRACARRGATGMAKQCQGDLDRFLTTLGKHVGPQNARREGNLVHLGYDKCFCPLVASGPARLSPTYCNCSRGWVKEMMEIVVGKPVEVELLGSIKRGDPACRFVVRV